VEEIARQGIELETIMEGSIYRKNIPETLQFQLATLSGALNRSLISQDFITLHRSMLRASSRKKDDRG
jgi:hypothetical protein